MDRGEIIIYQTADGETRLDVRMENDSVWLTQAQMVELFNSTKQNVSLHINNIFKEGRARARGNCQGILDSSARGQSFC